MKKLFSFTAFLFLCALIQISPSYGQSQEPKELTEARNTHNVELQKAIKPANDRYLPKLEELKKQLTFKGDIKGAVAVEDIITKMSSGQPLEQQSDKGPQELREIKKNYMIELETATKPVNSLYLAKLEVLKQELALAGNLKGALAVEQEMENTNISVQPQPTKISLQELTSIIWQFGRGDGSIIANIQLRPDGTIGGYSHPNESRWAFENDELLFIGTNGRPTTRYNAFYKENDRWIISGPFQLANIMHILKEVGRTRAK